ncbi:Myb_DNA-binding domain-containing protein, partial [Cephalotus follicularis]
KSFIILSSAPFTSPTSPQRRRTQALIGVVHRDIKPRITSCSIVWGGFRVGTVEEAKAKEREMYPRMIQQPHHEEMQQQNQNHGGGSVEPFLDLTSDPKPRLRWTADLHDRFVDAVNQLGGPNSSTKNLSNCHDSYLMLGRCPSTCRGASK